jgi:lactoylglutathione lyase
MKIVFLNKGKTEIELVCDGKNRDIITGNDISWGFETESLDDVMALMKDRSIEIEEGPLQPNPYVKFFYQGS